MTRILSVTLMKHVFIKALGASRDKVSVADLPEGVEMSTQSDGSVVIARGPLRTWLSPVLVAAIDTEELDSFSGSPDRLSEPEIVQPSATIGQQPEAHSDDEGASGATAASDVAPATASGRRRRRK